MRAGRNPPKTSCCLVLFTRSGIASHATRDVPRIHPFGNPAIVSRRDPTRGFAMPPLRTVCLYRGWEAKLSVAAGSKSLRRITDPRWSTCRWLLSRSVVNHLTDVLPHLKPMSHSTAVKLRALENLAKFRRFLRAKTLQMATGQDFADRKRKRNSPTMLV